MNAKLVVYICVQWTLSTHIELVVYICVHTHKTCIIFTSVSWLNIYICVHTQTITRMSYRWLLQHGTTPPRLEFCLFHCLLSLLMPISNVVINIVVTIVKIAFQVRVAPPQNFVAPHPEGEGSKDHHS